MAYVVMQTEGVNTFFLLSSHHDGIWRNSWYVTTQVDNKGNRESLPAKDWFGIALEIYFGLILRQLVFVLILRQLVDGQLHLFYHKEKYKTCKIGVIYI